MEENTWRAPGVTLDKMLGRGTFGAVFQGHHQALGIDVAVKFIDLKGSVSPAKALKEARLMARLDHPNLLRIYDAGQLEQTLYLVLEFMDGGTLEGKHSYDAEGLLHSTRQLLSGLQSLHEAKVLHRDIKPANCLLRAKDQRVKLADLGIAVEHSTQAEYKEMAGTLPFMAPELLEKNPRYGARSDLYALGLTLLYMALPVPPYPQGSFTEILSWIGSGERPRLRQFRSDLSPRLVSLIERMCCPQREGRPESAAEALAELESAPRSARSIPAPSSTKTVGPWVLGELAFESSNWLSYIASHIQTGVIARFSHLQPFNSLSRSHALIGEAAEHASRLDHPKILAVLDWGMYEERPYVVTAPQGQPLKVLVESSGPLPELQALEAARDITEALEYLHQSGLVYQSLAPGSAMITPDGRSAALSWPIFCVPIGSPGLQDGKNLRIFIARYAPPEAFNKTGIITPSVDLYGIGEILFFLLTGKDAFEAETIPGLVTAKLQGPPDLSSFAPLLTKPTIRLITSLLAPEPEKRPQSATEIKQTLAHLIKHLTPSAIYDSSSNSSR